MTTIKIKLSILLLSLLTLFGCAPTVSLSHLENSKAAGGDESRRYYSFDKYFDELLTSGAVTEIALPEQPNLRVLKLSNVHPKNLYKLTKSSRKTCYIRILNDWYDVTKFYWRDIQKDFQVSEEVAKYAYQNGWTDGHDSGEKFALIDRKIRTLIENGISNLANDSLVPASQFIYGWNSSLNYTTLNINFCDDVDVSKEVKYAEYIKEAVSVYFNKGTNDAYFVRIKPEFLAPYGKSRIADALVQASVNVSRD